MEVSPGSVNLFYLQCEHIYRATADSNGFEKESTAEYTEDRTTFEARMMRSQHLNLHSVDF